MLRKAGQETAQSLPATGAKPGHFLTCASEDLGVPLHSLPHPFSCTVLADLGLRYSVDDYVSC